MSLSDLPLTKIFWTLLTLEAGVVAFMLLKVLSEAGTSRAANGGMVGAWLIIAPIVGLALVAAVFSAVSAPLVRVGLILLLLFPLWGAGVARPIHAVIGAIKDHRQQTLGERARLGEDIFSEAGPRQLAAAIADRDLERIRAALPGAGDINRPFLHPQAHGSALGRHETFLTFALRAADDSEATNQVVQLLLSAGANPNLPPAKPLTRAIGVGTRVTTTLLRAGADVNAGIGTSGVPAWWTVLEKGMSGTSDVAMLQLLLDHGADARKRLDRADGGPIETALDYQRWGLILLLARHIPGARDLVVPRVHYNGRDPEPLHARLAFEVKALQAIAQPVPADMSAALAAFESGVGLAAR